MLQILFYLSDERVVILVLNQLNIVEFSDSRSFVIFAKLVNCFLGTFSDAAVYHEVHIIDLVDLLGKDWAIIANMILNFDFVPLLANPTLGAIDPVGALLNVFVANYA